MVLVVAPKQSLIFLISTPQKGLGHEKQRQTEELSQIRGD